MLPTSECYLCCDHHTARRRPGRRAAPDYCVCSRCAPTTIEQGARGIEQNDGSRVQQQWAQWTEGIHHKRAKDCGQRAHADDCCVRHSRVCHTPSNHSSKFRRILFDDLEAPHLLFAKLAHAAHARLLSRHICGAARRRYTADTGWARTNRRGTQLVGRPAARKTATQSVACAVVLSPFVTVPGTYLAIWGWGLAS